MKATANTICRFKTLPAWLLLGLLACAAPLHAERESKFGRVILDQCDLIVLGVAGAQRVNASDLTRAELTLEQVLYGKDPKRALQVFYSDPATLKKDEAVRGLFALKAMSSGGYSLVGKPILVPESDVEQKDKLQVAKEFIALETDPEGDDRTQAFWKLLTSHVAQGGYAAQNAAVEFLFVARDRAGLVTEDNFADLRKLIAASKGLTKQCQADLTLALQGMVEARVKSLKFKRVRRAEKAADRRAALDDLKELQKTWPRAFNEADAKLCDALYDTEKDAQAQNDLQDLSLEIRLAERDRQAEEERKAAEARKKIEHAGG